MAYQKQNWQAQTVVTKSGLINMDEQIARNEENIGTHSNEIINIKTGTTKVGKAGVADSANSVEWTQVQNRPSTYPPSGHNHDDLYRRKSDGVIIIDDSTSKTFKLGIDNGALYYQEVIN